MNKWFLFKFFFLFSILTFPAFSASNLSKSVESIADMHYLRQETIVLLYDKHVNYEKAFNCKKVIEQRSGNRIDVVCTSKKNTVTLVILLGKNNYASYIMTCPALVSEKKLDPYNLGKSAFKSEEPRLVNGETRRTYYMGRTNGWVKDFENIFATTESGFMMNSCWALNKR